MVAVAPADGRPLPARDATEPALGPASVLEHAAVFGMLAWWAFPLTHGLGGRAPGPLAWALLTALPALLLTKPWQRHRMACVLAACVGAAALAVCLVSPTGWYGADAAAGYVYTALFAAVILGYARTPLRVALMAGAVVIAGIDQFAHAAQAWIGSQNAATVMVGTFYWHNPFAAFLIAPALLGAALAATSARRSLCVIGYLGSPLAVAGVVFSSSRASLAVLVVGFAILAVAAVRSGRSVVLRFAAVSALGVVITFALPGPPLFAHWKAPLSATEQRSSAGQTVAANSEYRTQFWREALQVAKKHPLTGSGYHALGTASEFTAPPAWARSPLAHNGYLQAASDGGLLLAVPFGVACVGVAFGALAALRRTRLRLTGETAITAAASVAALGLLAHSAVDFDWSHPALFAMTGLVAALGMAQGRTRDRSRGKPGREQGRRPVDPARWIGAALGFVAIVAAFGVREWASTDRLAHNGAPGQNHDTAVLLSHAGGVFGDYRPAEAVLKLADQGHIVAAQHLREAWKRTSKAAAIDPAIAALRARALALLGDRAAAGAAVDRLLTELGPERSGLVAADVSVTLHLLGQDDRARQLIGRILVADIDNQNLGRVWSDVQAAQRAGALADPVTRSCVVTTATLLAGPVPAGLAKGLPQPGPSGNRADCSGRIAALAK